LNINRKIQTEASLLKKKDVEFLLTSYKNIIRKLCINDKITATAETSEEIDKASNPLEYAFNCGSAFTLKMVLSTYCGIKEKELNELEEDLQHSVMDNTDSAVQFDSDLGDSVSSKG
jgi:hypothetical protein